MKKVISLARVGISLLLAVIICSLFCLVYTYSRVLVSAPTGASEVTSVANSIHSNMEEGLAWIRMDENGYNNVTAYSKTDVLIMGGSHVEGLQIAQRENLSYRLQNYLGNMKVYNVGESTHYLDNCVNCLDDACKNFEPAYVVIDINSLPLSKDGMKAVVDGTFRKREPAAENAWYRYVGDYIPVSIPLYSDLQKWMSFSTTKETIDDVETTDSEYGGVLNSFLAYAERIADRYSCKLIFLYHPSNYSVNSKGILQYEDESEALSILQTSCDNHNITLVNTKEENIRMYEEQRVLPNGFVNTSLGKGHLNRYGHEAAAKVLADTIMELERNADEIAGLFGNV